MSGRLDLESELRAALTAELASAKGEFPEWGLSPQSRRAQAWPGRSMRSLMPRKLMVATAAVVMLCVALTAGLLRVPGPNPGATTSPQASCDAFCGPTIWAAAAFDAQHIVAVGGSLGNGGSLVLVRTEDGGTTWSTERPDAPALTSLALAGGRLYGSRACQPTYLPESGASSADATHPSGADNSPRPAPASCLYYSDDRGITWHDAGAGRLVDPTFADVLHGWAHSEYDQLEQPPTTLYSTADGGRTWHVEPSPCDTATPWIEQAIATGPDAGYALCVGRYDPTAPLTENQAWELVQVGPGSVRTVRLSTGSPDLPPGTGNGSFSMRADGTGWVYTYSYDMTRIESHGGNVTVFAIRRTEDGGRSWTAPQEVSDWPGLQSVSFVSATAGFAVVPTGSKSTVMATTDGGRTWHVLATWTSPSFEPLPLPS